MDSSEVKTVKTTFKLSYTDMQYQHAVEYIEDMKRHPQRVFWKGKKGKSDKELIYSHITHRILSGFYNSYNPTYFSSRILSMENQN